MITIVRSTQPVFRRKVASEHDVKEHFVTIVRSKRAEPAAVSSDRRASGDNLRDVRIAGYLSTFKNATPADRQGDYVEPGAFRDTIENFMRNPVMLMDHQNAVSKVVGRFTLMREDNKGLYIEGVLSNAPGLADVRALLVEGALRTMSMGGMFYYKADGAGISKVDLYEGSLTPIPANPDAIIWVK